MAAKKKKKKAKKAAKPAKAKKAPAKKSKKVTKKGPAKKAKKPAKKVVKTAAKKAPVKKAPVKKAPAKKKQIVGEGDYAATRAFDKDQAGFVAKNKAKIPAMGKEAEKALDGPEGDALRDAEATAAARSRDTF
jgi:hypothetical protein